LLDEEDEDADDGKEEDDDMGVEVAGVADVVLYTRLVAGDHAGGSVCVHAGGSRGVTAIEAAAIIVRITVIVFFIVRPFLV
jgi:hypothetical protein